MLRGRVPGDAVTEERPVLGGRGNGPTSKLERSLAAAGHTAICGVDEVGRGAWAGPVSVGAMIWRPGCPVRGIRDSKELTAIQRGEAFTRLERRVEYGVGHCWPAEIDELGMTAALRLAALRAFEALLERHGVWPDVILLDGQHDFLAGLGRTETIVGGDARCVSVASASILAKVTRDSMMAEVADVHPAYSFATNKGYPAPEHVDALDLHGPCRLHRRTWAPIRDRLGLEPYVRSPPAQPAPQQPTLWSGKAE